MRDSDYYPAGAYNDPNAPYNEHRNSEKKFDCTVYETVYKDISIPTKNYREYYERNEDGGTDHWFEFDDVNWEDEYENSHDTLIEVLNKCHYTLKEILEYLVEGYKNGAISKDVIDRVMKLIDACEGWELEEHDVQHNDF